MTALHPTLPAAGFLVGAGGYVAFTGGQWIPLLAQARAFSRSCDH